MSIFVQNAKVSAPAAKLSIEIPGGFKAAFTAMDSLEAISNGKPVSGSKYTVAGETKIYFTPGPINSDTWDAGTASIACSFTFAVQQKKAAAGSPRPPVLQ